MPLYFFDIHDGIHIRDELGQDLDDLGVAKAEAARIATIYATDPKMLGDEGGVVVVAVRDDSDVVVLTVRLVFNIETHRYAAGLRAVGRPA